MEIKYCIECEEDVIVDVPDGHAVFISTGDNIYSVNFCYGPFASVQPPESMFDEDNWELVEEPTQEEMAIMNCNAEVLMQDFDYTDLKF